MRITVRVALALLLVVAVAGCQKVVYRDKLIEPPPDPDPPTPAEQLRGTWTSSEDGYWDENGELVGFTRETLTFTGDGRWINVYHGVVDGNVVNASTEFGGWSATADEITRHQIIWDGGHVEQTTVKSYVLDGDHLLLRSWDARVEDFPSDYRRYTRVDELVPTELAGTIWHRVPTDRNPQRMHLVMNEDGTFEFRDIWQGPEPAPRDYTLTGTWSLDVANQYIQTVITDATNNLLGEPATVDYPNRRFAYAWDGRLNYIVVSGFWNEPDHPSAKELGKRYGCYCSTFKLAESPLE